MIRQVFTLISNGLWRYGSFHCLVLMILGGSGMGMADDTRSGSAHLIPAPDPGWPQFRGPRRDGVSEEKGLLKSWPEGGPREVWVAEGLGQGYSSPIIVENNLLITGDLEGVVQIFSLGVDGRLRWKTTNGPAWIGEYPGARSSVSYSDGKIYHQNAHGRMVCLDAVSGNELWALDLLKQFEGKNITWGLSECPLVDERFVYATIGGKLASIVALDKQTGALVWKAEPFAQEGEADIEGANYVSPILVSFAGRRLVVGCTQRRLFCVDAETGLLEWMIPRPTRYGVKAMMPTLVEDRIFMTAPMGPPGQVYQLITPGEEGGKVKVVPGWTTRLDTCQGGVVYWEGKLYGAYYPGRKGWAALDAETGKELFTEPGIVKGAILVADRRFYILSEDGWMRLLEPLEDRFEVRGAFRLETTRNDAWAHPVVLDGRMYLRYHDQLRCYDVRE